MRGGKDHRTRADKERAPVHYLYQSIEKQATSGVTAESIRQTVPPCEGPGGAYRRPAGGV